MDQWITHGLIHQNYNKNKNLRFRFIVKASQAKIRQFDLAFVIK